MVLLLWDCGLVILSLFRDRNLQVLDLSVLLEKLVEQHRVHRFVADRVRFALLVTSHQVWVDLCYFLSHEAELRECQPGRGHVYNGR